MRARAAAFVFVSLLSFPALSQVQFVPPTAEELKMTEDPKAPGAAAVYLNMTEEDNDPMHYQAFYARIKVLTEKGKDLAVVELPYTARSFKITDIKARTIHADGSIFPLEGKPEDILALKKGDLTISRKVFTLPKVEVGSILEYSYQIRYDDNMYSSPEWEVQQKYYVHKAHYSFIPWPAFQPGPKGQQSGSNYMIDGHGRVINSLFWWPKLPVGVGIKTDVGGHYSVDVQDIPAIPDEDWMPPVQGTFYRVTFYYQSAFTVQDFWATSGKDWTKDCDRFAEVSSGLRSAVGQIIAAGDTDEVKARKLYAAVQALENTDYTRKKSETEMKALKLKEVKHAEDVWKQKSGSSDEIALLYLAMLRAAGLKAYPVQVVNRDRAIFDSSYMSMRQFDDVLVDLTVGTERMLLDPGEKMCPFRTVKWRHAGVRGLAESDAGPALLLTPELSYKDSMLSRRGVVTLDAHGTINGALQYIMTGQEALRWRQIALRNGLDELKKIFDKEMEGDLPLGVEAHVDHFLALDTPDSNLIAIINATGKVGTATSKRIMLPAQFFEARANHPFVKQEHRVEPVDMQYAMQEADQVDYKLPAGYTVEGAPQDANIPWAGHAVMAIKTASKPAKDDQPATLTVARHLARAFSQAKPEEYQDLRGFYLKVAAADQQQIVLAAPAQGGN